MLPHRLSLLFCIAFIAVVAQAQRCSWGSWASWKNCQSGCGAPTGTRSRQCLCNGIASSNSNCGSTTSTATGYCASTCVRPISYWTYYNSDADESRFEKPWPVTDSEESGFQCSVYPTASMKLPWVQILRLAPSNLWIQLAQQYIVTKQNMAMLASVPTTIQTAATTAYSIITKCLDPAGTGYSGTQVINTLSTLNTWNEGRGGTTLCQDPVCCLAGEWSAWSACSNSCGDGTSVRSKPCVCPGGLSNTTWDKCASSSEPTQPTDSVDCTDDFSCCQWQWNDWEECQGTCGGSGTQTRTQNCACSDGSCLGDPETDSRSCEPSCCSWKDWSDWSDCDADCGFGEKTRSRECECADPSDPDNYESADESNCGDADDASDTSTCLSTKSFGCCVWDELSDWSSCDRLCGGGVQLRSEICSCSGDPVNASICVKAFGAPRTVQRFCNLMPCVDPKSYLYWKANNIYTGMTPWPIIETTPFHCSNNTDVLASVTNPVEQGSLTWYSVMMLPTEGITWIRLSRQYITAKLNQAVGSVMTVDVSQTISEAELVVSACGVYAPQGNEDDVRNSGGVVSEKYALKIAAYLQYYNENKLGVATDQVKFNDFDADSAVFADNYVVSGTPPTANKDSAGEMILYFVVVPGVILVGVIAMIAGIRYLRNNRNSMTRVVV